MGINTKQLIELIIQPTLKDLDLYSLSAEQLLAGTCAQESQMGTYIAQMNGPALGIYQMEPITHKDIWANFIGHNSDLRSHLPGLGFPEDMVNDVRYATIMARIHYLRIKEPLPPANDIPAMAAYYKKYYNTPNGKATEQQFIDNWNKYCASYYGDK